MSDVTLCFVDCETTGLDPDRHEVWELALIVEGHSNPANDGEWLWQIRPERLQDAENAALAISRFHERLHDRLAQRNRNQYPNPVIRLGRADSQTHTPMNWLEFCDEVDVLTRGARLVGAIPSFDEERVRKILIRFGFRPTWHYHIVDIEALMSGYLAGICSHADTEAEALRLLEVATPPWKSRDLSEAIGVVQSDEDVHTALGDARWAREVYHAVLG